MRRGRILKGDGMNLKRIETACASYRRTSDEGTRARLSFFEPIWDIQAKVADQVADASVPAFVAADLEQWYWGQVPFLSQAPVPVDAPLFASTARSIAEALVAQDAFDDAVAQALNARDWEKTVCSAPLTLAGSDPASYLDAVFEVLAESEGEAVAETSAMVLSLALRPMLEPAASAALEAIAADIKAAHNQHAKPRLCPVCGGEASVAFVGPTASGKTNGRTLYCHQCGATWEVERIRCVRCGTQDESQLHYRSIEGDDAHRIHVCDRCKGYVRTRFADETGLAPFVPEVEDVVMVGLDALAADLGMGPQAQGR